MDWFAKNAAAIQAIASIVGVVITAALVGVTCWYVRVTKRIADSSVEQVNAMKDAARESRVRNVRALANLAARVRNGLATLNADVPMEQQLRGFMDVSEADSARLEVFASQVDSALILAAASTAVPAIREILGVVEYAKSVHPGAGWVMGQDRIIRWRRAREESDRSLHEIENECAAILQQEAQ